MAQSDSFKMKRRLSLSMEVDGLYPNLEEEEDFVVSNQVSMNECQMLRRVLGVDKSDVLPKACKMASASQHKSFMSRLVGDSPDVAGKVSLNECHQLESTLKMVSGGITFLPVSCSSLLKHEEADMEDRFERENAKVYERLKRRNSWVGRQDFPPTST